MTSIKTVTILHSIAPLGYHESIEYDFYYIKNQSLLLDFVIIIRTIGAVLAGKGAY